MVLVLLLSYFFRYFIHHCLLLSLTFQLIVSYKVHIIYIYIVSLHVIQHDTSRKSSGQVTQTWCRCVTWAEGLQEPGASGPARCAGFRLSGAEGSDGFDIGLVVACSRDLEHRDDCTLVQQAVRRHHLSVALLTAAHSRLTHKGGTERVNTTTASL